MDLRTGARVGSYEVLGPLGAGGMGEVYRALDTRLGREVALAYAHASGVVHRATAGKAPKRRPSA